MPVEEGVPAPVGAPGQAPGRRRRALWTVVALVAVALAVRALVLTPFTVGSGSMEPTVRTGATALVDRLTPRLRGWQPGDVVAFRSPADGALTLKRVVALGGQRVALEDTVLVVDGRPVDEPYAADRGDGIYFGPVTVPEGSVFVLGDDRLASLDSRTFGPVPVDDLVGRLVGSWSW